MNMLFYSSSAACTVHYPFVAGFLYRPAAQQRIKTQLLWPHAVTAPCSLLNLNNGTSNHGLNWKRCACSVPNHTYNWSVTPVWEENYKLLMAGFIRLSDIVLPSSVNHVIISRAMVALVARQTPVQLRAVWELSRSSSPSQQLFSPRKRDQSLGV